jgi:hypothetical protein
LRSTLTLTFLFLALAVSPTRAEDPPRLAWKDGDRVILIGDTLIERDQKYGYLETLITAKNPDKTITFRNLGWSGDTVRGLSRSGFGPPSEGWSQLKSHILALKPSVLIVGYGMAESFEGEAGAGLPSFLSGYNALLDTCASLKPRLILLSPIRHEDLGRPLPDPARHNASIMKYRDAIESVANTRQGRFVDLTDLSATPYTEGNESLTDDGMHLTEFGSWILAQDFARKLGMTSKNDRTEARVDRNGGVKASRMAILQSKVGKNNLSLQASLITLPLPDPPRTAGGFVPFFGRGDKLMLAGGFPIAGNFRLSIDDRIQDEIGDAEQWAAGLVLTSGPDSDQVQALRKLINEKNLLYFHRWRPQNETYLFGFRKHEQGNNAREIPLFDPLVEAKEKEIARLRKPVPHLYELTRQPEPGK